MNMQTPTGNEQRACTTALRRGNRMETRAGSAAGSTHCSRNLPLSALPAPAPQGCSVPAPGSAPACGGLELGGHRAGPTAQRRKMPRKHHLVHPEGSAERWMKGLELPQPVCLLLGLPTPPDCPQDWDGAAAEPGQAGNHQHLLAHHPTNTARSGQEPRGVQGPAQSLLTPRTTLPWPGRSPPGPAPAASRDGRAVAPSWAAPPHPHTQLLPTHTGPTHTPLCPRLGLFSTTHSGAAERLILVPPPAAWAPALPLHPHPLPPCPANPS